MFYYPSPPVILILSGWGFRLSLKTPLDQKPLLLWACKNPMRHVILNHTGNLNWTCPQHLETVTDPHLRAENNCNTHRNAGQV